MAGPKELKRQRERERYALNRDAILKKRQEARDRKKAAAAILNEINTPSKPSGAMSPGYSIFSVCNNTFHESQVNSC